MAVVDSRVYGVVGGEKNICMFARVLFNAALELRIIVMKSFHLYVVCSGVE